MAVKKLNEILCMSLVGQDKAWADWEVTEEF